MKYIKRIDEAFIGPFVFNDKMSDEELKAMYDGALDGYANHSKGFQHAKSKYKEAYQAIEKILKKRGVSVDEAVLERYQDAVRDLHFEMDPKKAEEMKIAIGKSQGEVIRRKQIEGGNYSLRRFRKEIKYDKTGKDLGVFKPGSYMAATSKLGDGPHKKAVAKVKWNRKKYDQWLEDVASNDGWRNAFDMAQNAKHEPGLLQWAKKEFRGEDPMQRIQWDIEAFAESSFIKRYTEFLLEKKNEKESFEDKIEGDGYYKGISTSTARKKVDQMAKQSQMADDDPDAYKEMPGDTKGKKLLKKSKHTKAFDDLYADEALKEMITNESVMGDLHIMMEEAKNFNQFRKMFYEEFSDRVKPNKDLDKWLKDLYEDGLGESLEEKAGGDRSPIKGKGIETGLKKKSEQTGVSLPLLRLVMRRGMAAWKSGHRPGAGQEQWGYARVNSFLTKAPGTWGRPLDNPKKNGPKGKFGADADIAKEVIKKGEDKKLKTTGLPK